MSPPNALGGAKRDYEIAQMLMNMSNQGQPNNIFSALAGPLATFGAMRAGEKYGAAKDAATAERATKLTGAVQAMEPEIGAQGVASMLAMLDPNDPDGSLATALAMQGGAYRLGAGRRGEARDDRAFQYRQTRDAVGDGQWAQTFGRGVFESDRTFNRQGERDAVGDQRYEDATTYARGRDAVGDARYEDSTKYGRERDAVGDQRWQDTFARDGIVSAIGPDGKPTFAQPDGSGNMNPLAGATPPVAADRSTDSWKNNDPMYDPATNKVVQTQTNSRTGETRLAPGGFVPAQKNDVTGEFSPPPGFTPSNAPPGPTSEAAPARTWQEYIADLLAGGGAATASTGDPRMDKRIKVESGGDANAVSPKGAVGVGQIMPETARDPGYGVPDIFTIARMLGRDVPDTSDATLQRLLRDENVNAAFGLAYQNAMDREFGGDKRLGDAAYNAGPGAVAKYGGVPPFAETQGYVDKMGSPDAATASQMAGVQGPTVAAAGALTPQQMEAARNRGWNPQAAAIPAPVKPGGGVDSAAMQPNIPYRVMGKDGSTRTIVKTPDGRFQEVM